MGKLTTQERVARSMTEAELQQAIIEMATSFGWQVFHVRDSRKQRVVGLPDLRLYRDRAEEWELKTELGKVSPVQEDVIRLLRLCGVVVRVVRPSDWLEERVLGWLR